MIRNRHGVVVSKRSIQRAIDALAPPQRSPSSRTGTLRYRRNDVRGLDLSCSDADALQEVGCEHYRLLRGREIQLIRPTGET